MPAQQFVDFAEGTLDLAGIDATTTTITSSLFATLPVISGGDTLILVIDPEETSGTVEIVQVTAHTASATTLTATRGVQGTSGSVHAIDVPWIAPVTSASLQEWEGHVDNQSNPHGVTAAQTAATPASHVGSTGAQHGDATGAVAGFMTAADKSKLDGIEAAAKDDQTISAGAGITVTGAPNPTISHADTSSQASVANVAGTVVEDVTLDTYGHITAIGSRNLSPADIGAAAIGADRQKVDQDFLSSTAALTLTSEDPRHTITFSGLTAGKSYVVTGLGQVLTTGQTLGYRTNGRIVIAGSLGLLQTAAAAGKDAASSCASVSPVYALTLTGSTSYTVVLRAWRESGAVPVGVSTQLSATLVEV